MARACLGEEYGDLEVIWRKLKKPMCVINVLQCCAAPTSSVDLHYLVGHANSRNRDDVQYFFGVFVFVFVSGFVGR